MVSQHNPGRSFQNKSQFKGPAEAGLRVYSSTSLFVLELALRISKFSVPIRDALTLSKSPVL